MSLRYRIPFLALVGLAVASTGAGPAVFRAAAQIPTGPQGVQPASPLAGLEWEIPDGLDVDPLWVAGSALFLGAAALDEPIQTLAPAGGTGRLRPYVEALNQTGYPEYLLPVLGATYLGARLTGSGSTAHTAAHLAAVLVAAGIPNGALKVLVGRRRPVEGGEPDEFRPLAIENRWQSFPSGHSVVVFALASALASEARPRWVAPASYATAALVGVGRVYLDRHWASDVVAGALVGIGTARTVDRLLHRDGGAVEEAVSVTIHLIPGGIAVRVPIG